MSYCDNCDYAFCTSCLKPYHRAIHCGLTESEMCEMIRQRENDDRLVQERDRIRRIQEEHLLAQEIERDKKSKQKQMQQKANTSRKAIPIARPSGSTHDAKWIFQASSSSSTSSNSSSASKLKEIIPPTRRSTKTILDINTRHIRRSLETEDLKLAYPLKLDWSPANEEDEEDGRQSYLNGYSGNITSFVDRPVVLPAVTARTAAVATIAAVESYDMEDKDVVTMQTWTDWQFQCFRRQLAEEARVLLGARPVFAAEEDDRRSRSYSASPSSVDMGAAEDRSVHELQDTAKEIIIERSISLPSLRTSFDEEPKEDGYKSQEYLQQYINTAQIARIYQTEYEQENNESDETETVEVSDDAKNLLSVIGEKTIEYAEESEDKEELQNAPQKIEYSPPPTALQSMPAQPPPEEITQAIATASTVRMDVSTQKDDSEEESVSTITHTDEVNQKMVDKTETINEVEDRKVVIFEDKTIDEYMVDTDLANERNESVSDNQVETIPEEVTDSKLESGDEVTDIKKPEIVVEEREASATEDNVADAQTPNKTTRRPSKVEKEKLKAKNGLDGAQRRLSRSNSPPTRARRLSHAPQHVYIKTTPAIPMNANIREILQNVAKTEGPFENPLEACKAAYFALIDETWTTKVEGMLAIARLATFHQSILVKNQLHAMVRALVAEVKNLRSAVSRSAIFTIGELFAKMGPQLEPELDTLVCALLNKSGENVAFIREDIDRALSICVETMPQTRVAIALITNGSNHRNASVRRVCAQFVCSLVTRMGAMKSLMGPRDVGMHICRAAARFVQDGSQHTRFFGRKIFAVLMTNNAFDRVLRKHVTAGTYRNISGILESIKRRGIGDPPSNCRSNETEAGADTTLP